MTGFSNIQAYVRAVVMPFVVSLRDKISTNTDYLLGQVQQHSARTDNPHMTKLAQMATISTAAPTASQGQDGDVWIQLID